MVNSAIAQNNSVDRLAEAMQYTDIPFLDGETLTPDWMSLNFAGFPPSETPGSISFDNLPSDLAQYIGYDLSRQWEAGASAADILKLGDLADLGIGELSLRNIGLAAGLPLDGVPLEAFKVLLNQDLGTLVRTIPGLENFKLSDIEPLADLVKNVIPNAAQFLNRSLFDLSSDSLLGKLSLKDLSLEKFDLKSIPGLDLVPLNKFQDWKNVALSGVPLADLIPFETLFGLNPLKFLGFLAIHDVTYGGNQFHKESGAKMTPTKFSISGSYQAGFKVNCAQEKGCDYIELESPISLGPLGDPTNLHGARWIRGGKGPGEQMVKGGFGPLGELLGGKEPTGRHPFGSAFKVVLVDTDESTGTGKFGLYFRVCATLPFIGKTCTPYVIGPLPWFPTKEKGLVFVGLTPGKEPPGITPPEAPDAVKKFLEQHNQTGENNAEASEDCVKAAIAAAPSGTRNDAAKIIPIVLSEASKAGISDRRQIAYILASIETESHFRPRSEEGGRLCNYYESGCWGGRGLIQITHPYNYQYWSKRLGVDLMANPDLANRVDVSVRIAVSGMKEGIFTGLTANGTPTGSGYKLSQYINATRKDYRGARNIVNPSDQAKRPSTASAAERYEKALASCAGTEGDGKATCSYTHPAPGSIVTSGYGMRGNPITKVYRMHNGKDYGVAGNRPGKPILAADGGLIVEAINDCPLNNRTCGGGYGNRVYIQHCQGRLTRYAHMMRGSVTLRRGQKVSKGQQIGRMDTTGSSTGVHLHFETHVNNKPVDPAQYGL